MRKKMKYQFEVLEKAIGKERPRYSAKTNRMYTPTKTASFEEKVKWAFKAKYNIETELSTKPFKAKIIAVFTPPESLSKKKKEELLFQVNYTKKPDIDNIAKAILDSLNGLAYKDDSQVSALLVLKDYGVENKIIVELEEIYMSEEKALKYFKRLINITRQEEIKNNIKIGVQITTDMAEQLLNLIQKQQKEIEFYKKSICEDYCPQLREKDEIIDTMAKYIAGLDIDEDICSKNKAKKCSEAFESDDIYEYCVNCIKQYFERKVENEI